MLRTLLSIAVVALSLSLPASLFAGGPPWLCLPIDGVTAGNAAACGELLTTKLKDKLWKHAGRDPAVKLQQHDSLWYATFYMGEQVGLSDVEGALKGSKFSVPRSKLRLFGHVILEVDASQPSPKELLAAMEGIDYVSIEKSAEKEDRLLVTLDMPHPHEEQARGELSVGWDAFRRNDFSFDQAARASEQPATAEQLPGYDTLRDIVAKHKASLKDVAWSPNYACRPLGGVTVKDPAAKETKGTGAVR